MNDPLNAAQPPPVPNDAPAVWDLVVADMRERDAVGAERYGTRLQPNNGRDALVDAYQEALDLTVYLRQAIAERRQVADRDPNRVAREARVDVTDDERRDLEDVGRTFMDWVEHRAPGYVYDFSPVEIVDRLIDREFDEAMARVDRAIEDLVPCPSDGRQGFLTIIRQAVGYRVSGASPNTSDASPVLAIMVAAARVRPTPPIAPPEGSDAVGVDDDHRPFTAAADQEARRLRADLANAKDAEYADR